jgi:hypothetical protein
MPNLLGNADGNASLFKGNSQTTTKLPRHQKLFQWTGANPQQQR